MRACQDRGWDNIGVMETDWNDKGPDAFRARRELYNACNGRIFTFDGKAFIVEDKSDYMKLGSQSAHHDYCKATDSIVHAEEDDGFETLRSLLTEHLRIVSGGASCAGKRFRWLKPASECRPGFL